jgi:hypothetical protein
MPGLALFIAWNQIATSAALLGVAFVTSGLYAARAPASLSSPRLLPKGHARQTSRENLSYTSGQPLSSFHRSAGGQLANVRTDATSDVIERDPPSLLSGATAREARRT